LIYECSPCVLFRHSNMPNYMCYGKFLFGNFSKNSTAIHSTLTMFWQHTPRFVWSVKSLFSDFWYNPMALNLSFFCFNFILIDKSLAVAISWTSHKKLSLYYSFLGSTEPVANYLENFTNNKPSGTQNNPAYLRRLYAICNDYELLCIVTNWKY